MREAARHAEEVVTLEPFRETAYRHLMQVHAAAGNPAEALRVYEHCRRFLADELGAYPSPETEAAYVEILRVKRARPTEDRVPVGDVQAPPRRHRRAVVVGVAIVLAGVVTTAAFQLLRQEGAKASPLGVERNAIAALDAASGDASGVVEAPVPPTAMATGLGYVLGRERRFEHGRRT